MSVRLVAWARNQRTGDPATQLVLLLLADHADADGLCWPSYRLLAADACISERTAMRVIRGLIEAGLVRKDASKGRYANRYWLLAGPEHLRESGRPNGDRLSGSTVTNGEPTVTQVSPEPSLEPREGARASSPEEGSRALPEDIWAHVARARGEAYAGSWLGRVGWDAERRALITPTELGARRLRLDFRGGLPGVALIERKGAADG